MSEPAVRTCAWVRSVAAVNWTIVEPVRRSSSRANRTASTWT
ncbi:hypothetical protein ACIPRD_31340 [Streptomyces sp. NPDC090108]